MIILVSHGHLALGMKHTVEMIVGEREDLVAFGAYCDGVNSTQPKIREVIQSHPDDEIIVITDVLGGSVNNEMVQLLPEFPNLQVIAGMNLSLVLTILTGCGRILAEAIREGQNGIVDVRATLVAFEEEDL
ncbi:TPA: PTS sugar transporter subunit IIA [Streptococcus suis]